MFCALVEDFENLVKGVGSRGFAHPFREHGLTPMHKYIAGFEDRGGPIMIRESSSSAYHVSPEHRALGSDFCSLAKPGERGLCGVASKERDTGSMTEPRMIERMQWAAKFDFLDHVHRNEFVGKQIRDA